MKEDMDMSTKIRCFLLLLGVIHNSVYGQDVSVHEPKVTPDFEKFDFARYNYLLENEPEEENESYRQETLSDGRVYFRNIWQGEPYSLEMYSDSYFILNKDFYPNGNIKEKGLRLNVSIVFRKGIWYYFDERGKMIRQIDYDKDYKFTFEDIVRFCRDRDIHLTKGVANEPGVFYTKIFRSKTEQGKPIWEIRYYIAETNDVMEITLDGNTGKVVNERRYGYEY